MFEGRTGWYNKILNYINATQMIYKWCNTCNLKEIHYKYNSYEKNIFNNFKIKYRKRDYLIGKKCRTGHIAKHKSKKKNQTKNKGMKKARQLHKQLPNPKSK